MNRLIEGKVAQILSDKYLVVNVGAAAGVKVGMRFVVLARGEEVKDPATGEVLGQWEVPKGFLRATHVQERLSTCEGSSPFPGENAAEDSSTGVLSAAMITASMRPETWRGGMRLDVNRAQVAGMPFVGPISVGDTVRELRPEQIAAIGPAAEGKAPAG